MTMPCLSELVRCSLRRRWFSCPEFSEQPPQRLRNERKPFCAASCSNPSALRVFALWSAAFYVSQTLTRVYYPNGYVRTSAARSHHGSGATFESQAYRCSGRVRGLHRSTGDAGTTHIPTLRVVLRARRVPNTIVSTPEQRTQFGDVLLVITNP